MTQTTLLLASQMSLAMEYLDETKVSSNIPMLSLDGGNWPTFKSKFEDYVEGLGIFTHFDIKNYPTSDYNGIKKKPDQGSQEPEVDFKKWLAVWKEGEKEWKAEVLMWKKNDARARSTFRRVIPNLMYVEILKKHDRVFYRMWTEVESWIEQIMKHQRSNLKGILNQMKCGEQDNV